MIFKGKSIEEALLEAEKQTGKKIDEIIYEVIEQKKGIFRSNEISINVIDFKKSGKVRIENGRLIVTPGEIPPALSPGDNIRLTLNGSTVNRRISVKESDDILIEVINTQAMREIKISLSENMLEAYAEISYTPQRTFKVKDSGDEEKLTVEAELVEEIHPPFYTREDFESVLKENKIKIGIQWENIKSILKGGKDLVAKGVMPIEPQDDSVKYFFDTENEKKPLEIDGKVDYYNIGKIDFVEEGKILAVRNEGTEGKSGLDVLGNHLPPTKRTVLKLLKGPGCEVLDNGNRAISLIKGMPSIKNNRICVYPAHIIQGDVDLKTGNIDFDGDVIVKGNLVEGMKITAGNNVTVTGDVLNAEIISTGNITVGRSIIGSSLKAGNNQLIDQQGVEHLKKLEHFLEYFLRALKQVFSTTNGNGSHDVGHISKLILESKFQEDKNRILEAFKYLKTPGISADIVGIWGKFYDIYKELISGQFRDISLLQKHLQIVASYLTTCDIKLAPANAIISYSQNSEIIATQDVEIKGKGCYSTNIYAQNEVKSSGASSVFRGGEIIAPKGIHLKECGSNAGVKTLLKTSKNGLIEIQTAYQNTIMYFDELIYKLENPARNLKAYVNKGEIIVEKLKL